MTTTFIISFFPKLPNLTALSLLSHLPLIKHLPDPFLLLCRQCNSFHSSLLNEMGKHTHTWGVCVERGISAVFQDQGMQVAGMCSIYIYTHTHSATPGTFRTEMCPALAHRGAMCVDLMESGSPWQCDKLLITCDQNSTQRRALLFFSFPGREWVMYWNALSLHPFWFPFLVFVFVAFFILIAGLLA